MSDAEPTAHPSDFGATALPEPMRRELAFVLDRDDLASGPVRGSARPAGPRKSAKVAALLVGVLTTCAAGMVLLSDTRTARLTDEGRSRPIRPEAGRPVAADVLARRREPILLNGLESVSVETSRPGRIDAPRPASGSRGVEEATSAAVARAVPPVDPGTVVEPDRRASISEMPRLASPRPVPAGPSASMVAGVPDGSGLPGRTAPTPAADVSDPTARRRERRPNVVVAAQPAPARQSNAVSRRDGSDAILDLRRQW